MIYLCFSAVQRTQPETIVSQLMSALTQSPRSAYSPTMIPHDKSPTQIHSPHTLTGRRISTRQNASAVHKCWQLGFAKVTGLVRIQTQSSYEEYPTNTATQDQVLRIQVRMPTWLCALVLDAVFSRSYAGWHCSLNMYGRIREDSAEFHLVWASILDDDVDAIHGLFQERRCGPLDVLVSSRGIETSLLWVSKLRPSLVHLVMTCNLEIVATFC